MASSNLVIPTYFLSFTAIILFTASLKEMCPSENVVAYPDHPHTEGVSIHEDLIDKHKTEMPAPPHHEGYRPIREFGKNIETENLTPYSDQSREITPATFIDDLNLGSFA